MLYSEKHCVVPICLVNSNKMIRLRFPVFLFSILAAASFVCAAENTPTPEAPSTTESGGIGKFIKDHNLNVFSDLYAAAVRLDRIHSTASYGSVRYGLRSENYKWEMYGTVRGAGDTRTGTDTDGLGQIYNDNFLFTGLGVDYIHGDFPFSGSGSLRLSAQVGESFDLKDHINRGGFDYRVGFMTYNEVPFQKIRVVEEIYSDALYFQRYKNFIATIQARTMWNILDEKINENYQLKLGPLVTLSTGIDTKELDYNRYTEFILGGRLSLKGPISVSIEPQHVEGTRYDRPTHLPYYHDFRVLMTFYCSF